MSNEIYSEGPWVDLVHQQAEQAHAVQDVAGQKLFSDAVGPGSGDIVKDSAELNNLAIVDSASNPGIKSDAALVTQQAEQNGAAVVKDVNCSLPVTITEPTKH